MKAVLVVLGILVAILGSVVGVQYVTNFRLQTTISEKQAKIALLEEQAGAFQKRLANEVKMRSFYEDQTKEWERVATPTIKESCRIYYEPAECEQLLIRPGSLRLAFTIQARQRR